MSFAGKGANIKAFWKQLLREGSPSYLLVLPVSTQSELRNLTVGFVNADPGSCLARWFPGWAAAAPNEPVLMPRKDQDKEVEYRHYQQGK